MNVVIPSSPKPLAFASRDTTSLAIPSVPKHPTTVVTPAVIKLVKVLPQEFEMKRVAQWITTTSRATTNAKASDWLFFERNLTT